MVMEADLFVQTTTTSEATSTGNTTTESVVQLPRVSSSPVITSSSGGATASLTASASSVVLGSKEAELAATAAAAGNNLILEDEDAFLLPTGGCSTSGGGGGGGGSTRNRPMMSSNYYRQPSRRERRQRSLSSISSPNSHFAGASHGQQPQQPQQSSASAQQPHSASSQQPRSHHHQRSTSAILDLGFEPAASKRRSLSTAAASDGSSTDLQVGDKPKISKSVSDNLIVTSTSSGASVTSPSSSTSTLASEIEAGLMTSVSPSASAVFASSGEKVIGGSNPWTDSPWTLESSSKLPVSKSRMVPSASTGGHVRFTETDNKPYKCHHLLNSDETEPSQRWLASMPSTAASANPGQTVQRANSNPEMELCSVCLARKECEILLKRTWSKVNLLIN